MVVVLHEAFGANADMRAACDDFAAQGFLALCPDLLWRAEPGIELSDRTPAELERASALCRAFDLDTGAEDVAQTILTARVMPGSSGKVGVVGFCLGGLMSLLAAARVDVDAAVAYYPGNADRHLGVVSRIDCPLLVHLAQDDEYIPAAAQAGIAWALAGCPQAQVHAYPGLRHAFARRGGAHFDAAAAALSSGRTADFLAANLK